jgi:CRP-like cAMP-binding protein
LVPAPFLKNRLLACLSPADFELLQPHLQYVQLSAGDVLVEVGERIDRAYFLHSGIVSFVVGLADGETVEVGMMGREGAVGTAAALAGDTALNTAVMRLAGSASVVDGDRLRGVVERSAALRSMLALYQRAMFAQAQQYAACNASHAVEFRLSRSLMQMRDLSGGDSLFVTQEALSQMLGVRRNSVSAVAHALQQANLIRYSRGHIEIIDPEGLQKSACECYATVKGHRERLLCVPAEPASRPHPTRRLEQRP